MNLQGLSSYSAKLRVLFRMDKVRKILRRNVKKFFTNRMSLSLKILEILRHLIFWKYDQWFHFPVVSNQKKNRRFRFIRKTIVVSSFTSIKKSDILENIFFFKCETFPAVLEMTIIIILTIPIKIFT